MTSDATRPRRRATVQDVANLAGVSAPTVSRALNGKGRVGAQTRARIEHAARILQFSPNPLAQGLLAGRTGTVGLITNDLEGRFSIPVLIGAEDALGEGSTSVFLCDARGDSDRERRHVDALLNRRVDGLIVVADRTDPRRSLGSDLPVPVVYAYGPSESASDLSVIPDNVGAGRLAASHALALGRRHIAYVAGDPTYQAAEERARGARSVLREAGVDFVGGVPLYGKWSEIWGREAATLLLKSGDPIDAVLCGSDQVARGVLDTFREHGVSIPEEVAVIGHDNWLPLATQTVPPLTTIDMDLETVGRVAAHMLFEAMGERENSESGRGSTTRLIESRLVIRGSSSLAPQPG